jgi:hypothetical protein
VLDLNKTMVNVTKEPSVTHMKTLKEEILEEIAEKIIEKIVIMVKKKVQDALKKISRHQK